MLLILLLSAGRVRSDTGPFPASRILEDSIPRLGRVASSPEQLLRNALARLRTRDTLGLILMGPDPDQFFAIFDKTPEGKTATEIHRNFAREFYYMDNGKLLARRLSRDGGRQFELVSWKSASAPVSVEGGAKILRDVEIRVMDKANGTIRTLPFVKSIYVDPQGCKIWGFQDDKAGS